MKPTLTLFITALSYILHLNTRENGGRLNKIIERNLIFKSFLSDLSRQCGDNFLLGLLNIFTVTWENLSFRIHSFALVVKLKRREERRCQIGNIGICLASFDLKTREKKMVIDTVSRMENVNTEFQKNLPFLPLDLFFGLSWSVDVAVAARLPWEQVILGTVSLTTLLYYHLHLPSSLQTGITINYHLPFSHPPTQPNIITNLSATTEFYLDFIIIREKERVGSLGRINC